MLDQLNEYDWAMAFQCCGPAEPGDSAYNTPSVSLALGATGSDAPFTREDVAEILGLSEGENDGPNWLGLFKLRDGRYAFLSAGCDYTGWDCQSGGSALVSDDLEILKRNISPEERARMGLA